MYTPYPYPDEALESVVARLQRHLCLNPREVKRKFGSNCLGGYAYIEILSDLLKQAFPVEQLIAEHTMVPLLRNLNDSTYPRFAYRYCPECLKEQLETHGETFWRREWLFCGVCYCPIHNKPLVLASFKGKRAMFDHCRDFVVPEDVEYRLSRPVVSTHCMKEMSKCLMELLAKPAPRTVATPVQWRDFWIRLLENNGYTSNNLNTLQQNLLGYWEFDGKLPSELSSDDLYAGMSRYDWVHELFAKSSSIGIRWRWDQTLQLWKVLCPDISIEELHAQALSMPCNP